MEREQACDNGMLKRRKKHEIRDRTEEGGGGERFVMDGWDGKRSQAFQIVTRSPLESVCRSGFAKEGSILVLMPGGGLCVGCDPFRAVCK